MTLEPETLDEHFADESRIRNSTEEVGQRTCGAGRSSTDVNTESVESVCATAEALFGPYVQTLESEFKEAYRSRNIKDVKKRKPLPAWMQNRNDFVWHPPNPTMLAHATTQDFQRPAFWICIHTSILRYCDQRFKSSSFLSVERAFYIP